MESIHKYFQFNSMQPLVIKPLKTSLGIFWDIENCPIPHSKSPSNVVKHIRDYIGVRHPECGYPQEFFVVANIDPMTPHLRDSLNRNGVTVVHVNGAAKNAADDKLQELMDMFVDKFGAGAVLTVITGDINFVRTIRNARRKDVVVVLIHGTHASEDLKNTANESYLYDGVIRGAYTITQNDKQLNPAYLKVSNLPKEVPSQTVINRLFQLSVNCGGKVESIAGEEAVIKFGCKDDAQRAAQRMAGMDCFGHKIDVKLIDSMAPKKETIKLSNDSQVNGNTVALTNVSDKVMDNQLIGSAISLNGDQNVLVHKDIGPQPVVKPIVFGTKPSDKKRKFSDTTDNDSNKENKKLNMGTVDEKYGNKLVIRGLSAKRNHNWRQKVKRNAKHYGKVFPVTNTETNIALVNGARNYLKTESGIPHKQMVVNDDCKSIIKGLHTNGAKNKTKLVRNLVMKWMDNKIHGNFITHVEVIPNFETVINGNKYCPSLLVTASSARN